MSMQCKMIFHFCVNKTMTIVNFLFKCPKHNLFTQNEDWIYTPDEWNSNEIRFIKTILGLVNDHAYHNNCNRYIFQEVMNIESELDKSNWTYTLNFIPDELDTFAPPVFDIQKKPIGYSVRLYLPHDK